MSDFEALYKQHIDAVFRFALRSVGRRDVAEDITSEAFLALYRNRDVIDPGQLPAWLFTVVKNRAVDYWRHDALERSYRAARVAPVATPPADLSLLELLKGQRKLKPAHRACLILRYLYGMDRTEIANETGLSENQVKASLQYGLQLLRKEFVKAE